MQETVLSHLNTCEEGLGRDEIKENSYRYMSAIHFFVKSRKVENTARSRTN